MKEGYINEFWSGGYLDEEEKKGYEMPGCNWIERWELTTWNGSTGKNEARKQNLDSERYENVYTLHINKYYYYYYYYYHIFITR